MLHREIRQRQEYLYKKSKEADEISKFNKKQILKNALENSVVLPKTLRQESRKLLQSLNAEDERTYNIDIKLADEYFKVGINLPKVLITTSRNPTQKLITFTKELKLLIPDSSRVNRGQWMMKELFKIAKKYEYSDVIIIHEHRGSPDGLIISHLPFGPTA